MPLLMDINLVFPQYFADFFEGIFIIDGDEKKYNKEKKDKIDRKPVRAISSGDIGHSNAKYALNALKYSVKSQTGRS